MGNDLIIPGAVERLRCVTIKGTEQPTDEWQCEVRGALVMLGLQANVLKSLLRTCRSFNFAPSGASRGTS
jgi:hypothetical protein